MSLGARHNQFQHFSNRIGGSRAFVLFTVGLLLVAAAPVLADAGVDEPATCEIPGPDSGGYTCQVVGLTWLDTSGGDAVALGDDADAGPIALPFSFTWYGTSHGAVTIGSNGVLCFGDAVCDAQGPGAHPSGALPNALLACLWEDLDPSAAGTVRHASFGSAPDRVFAATFEAVPHWGSASFNTFQFQLHEQGDAACMFDTAASDADAAGSLVATESGDGSDGVRYTLGPLDGTDFGVLFAITPPDPPEALTAVPGPNGGEITLEWDPPASGESGTSYNVYRGASSGTHDPTPVGTTASGVHTFTDPGLGMDETWHYVVRSVRNGVESVDSNEATATTWAAPAAPANPSAQATSAGENTLTWDPPTDDGGSPVTDYHLYWSTTPGVTPDGTPDHTVPAGTTSHVHTALGNGETWHYVVTAVSAAGEGAGSTEVSATTWDVPDAPGDVTAVRGAAAGEIDLSWTLPADNGATVDTYHIYRSDAEDGTYTEIDAVPHPQTTFTDTGLGTGETWYYKISAENAAGEGPQGGPASARTMGAPSAPENVVAEDGATSIKLTWGDPEDDGGADVEHYTVYRSTTEGARGFGYLELPFGTNEFVDDNGLDCDRSFYYTVTASNALDEGADSAQAEGRITACEPSEPQNVQASRGQGVGEITVEWDAPERGPVTGYNVYLQGQDAPVAAGLHPATRSFTHGGHGPGEDHCYRVTATNDIGESDPSPVRCAQTFDVPGAAEGVDATPGPAEGEVTITWDEPADNGGLDVTSYDVLRRQAGSSSLVVVGDHLPASPRSFVYGPPNPVVYCYSLVARNPAGDGPVSAEACTTHQEEVPTPPSPPGAEPGEPRNPGADPGAAGEVLVDWSAPTTGTTPPDDYRVYRGTSPSAIDTLAATVQGSATTPPATQVTLTHLCTGTHYFQVAAVDAAGTEGPRSDIASTGGVFLTAPGSPTNLETSTPNAAGQVKVDWDEPSDDGGQPFSGYEVWGSDTAGELGTLLGTTAGGTTQFTESGLGPDTTRYYTVFALRSPCASESGAVKGPASVQVDGTSHALPGAPTISAVSTPRNPGELKVDWNAPADTGGMSITNYVVYRSTVAGTTGTPVLTTTSPSPRTFTDTGLDDATEYHYTVAAITAVGEGDGSAQVAGTTAGLPAPPDVATITVTPSTTPFELDIAWDAPADDGGTDIQGYKVYRIGRLNAVAEPTGTSATDTVPAGPTFCYRIATVSEVGEGAKSDERCGAAYKANAAATPQNLVAEPAQPGDPALPNLGLFQVKLTWDAPNTPPTTSPPTGYIVHKCDSAGENCTPYGGTDATPVPPDQRTYFAGDPTDTDFLGPAQHVFTVSAVNGFGESAQTGPACSYTLPWALLVGQDPLLAPCD